jgi:hypothetical protein
MKEQKYYRSPIDELVSKSNMSAKAIAEEMGIKYHRMVALRRLKDVQDDDLQNCERAIAALKDNPTAYRKPGQPKKQVIKNPHAEPDKSKPKSFRVETPTPEPKVRMLARLQRERTSNLAFMLGQTLGFVQNVFDSLQVNNVPIPDKILERKKQLEEQCNKLLDI